MPTVDMLDVDAALTAVADPANSCALRDSQGSLMVVLPDVAAALRFTAALTIELTHCDADPTPASATTLANAQDVTAAAHASWDRENRDKGIERGTNVLVLSYSGVRVTDSRPDLCRTCGQPQGDPLHHQGRPDHRYVRGGADID